MSPKGHSRVDVRVPEGEGLVGVHLSEQKPLQAQVEGDKIRTKQEMSVEKDIPEEKQDERQQDAQLEQVLLHAGCPRLGQHWI